MPFTVSLRIVRPALLVALLLGASLAAPAAVLWSDPGPILAHENEDGNDLLHGAVKRDDKATDTLYFKFRVDPLSDVSTEPYYAGFQLYTGVERHLAVGNSPTAWAYSAFYTAETWPTNKVHGDYDLSSSRPEQFSDADVQPYELPRRGTSRVIVFKVQYMPNGDDQVTVWLSPNLTLGADEENQLPTTVTKFKADASFDQAHVRHMGGGGGWTFSDMEIATSFNDLVVPRFWQTWWFVTSLSVAVLAAVGMSVRVVEKRRFQLQLRVAEQEGALERERARIARDLHDELGSSLTRISLLSNLAKTERGGPTQVEGHLEKITQSAEETVRALEEIVWAVRPGSDTLQSLVEYIAHFANELFDGNTTRCRLDLPTEVPVVSLPPELRHNIFLVVKEALTNVLRHSGAKEVMVQAHITGGRLEIIVRDDGRGFDAVTPSAALHNGLENMRRRAESIGGNLRMESASGKGTSITLSLDLPKNSTKASEGRA